MLRLDCRHALLAALLLAATTHAATAQANPPTAAQATPEAAPLKATVYSPDELKHLRAELQSKAEKNGGSASQELERFPQHYTMLGFRSQSGGAERHAKFADFFVVIEGSATLVTGGDIPGAKTASPGETRGPAIENGTQKTLEAGMIVHIPAGVPHQMKIQPGGSILYYVIKVQENPAP